MRLQVHVTSTDQRWTQAALAKPMDLLIYTHCCKPIDRVYIINGDQISFSVNNMELTPSVTGIIMQHTARPVNLAQFPAYLNQSVEAGSIQFSISPDASMKAGDHLTIEIEAVCENNPANPAQPPETALIDQLVMETFALDIYSYEGSFMVEN